MFADLAAKLFRDSNPRDFVENEATVSKPFADLKRTLSKAFVVICRVLTDKPYGFGSKVD